MSGGYHAVAATKCAAFLQKITRTSFYNLRSLILMMVVILLRLPRFLAKDKSSNFVSISSRSHTSSLLISLRTSNFASHVFVSA